MHDDTAYAILAGDRVRTHRIENGVRVPEEMALKVIPITARDAADRHGLLADGSPRPYKGYKGNSNYCIEIIRTPTGWAGEVISTFEAYQAVRRSGKESLRHQRLSLSGKPLVMRLMINDVVRLEVDERPRTMRVVKVNSNGQIFMADTHEANVDARNRDSSDPFVYISKTPSSLKRSNGRRVTISPIGDVRDSGFKE